MSDVHVVVGVGAAHVQRRLGPRRTVHSEDAQECFHAIEIGSLEAGERDVSNLDDRLFHIVSFVGVGDNRRQRVALLCPSGLFSLPDETKSMTAPPVSRMSTIGTWTTTLVRALDAQGIDGKGLAAAAGIDPERLFEPDARVPRLELTRL